jgi:hypothetical protein
MNKKGRQLRRLYDLLEAPIHGFVMHPLPIEFDQAPTPLKQGAIFNIKFNMVKSRIERFFFRDLVKLP